ncbi:DUF4434 domain-containing protein [Desulfoplanes formicivorans]|nr:DUF4434 domain-containing protein [Desulfoplanes formicivorans]
MNRIRMCLFLTVMTLMWTLPVHAGATRVGGTFLQPSNAMEQWDKTDWDTLFDTYEQLHIREVIVQWIDYSDSYAYCDQPCGYTPELIENILVHAARRNMHVTIGNVFLSSFWERIRSKPHLMKVHLKRVQKGTREALARVAPILKASPAFSGWYISQEIDDRTWLTPAFKDILCSFINNIYAELQTVAPGPVSISGFSNAWASPEKNAAFWREVAERTSLSRILFQDGVGAHKLEVDEVPIYLKALQTALTDVPCTVQPVLELFDQQDGEQFSAVPASPDRIRRQLKAELPYAPDGVILFSVMEYMSQYGGPQAEKLLENFMQFSKVL